MLCCVEYGRREAQDWLCDDRLPTQPGPHLNQQHLVGSQAAARRLCAPCEHDFRIQAIMRAQGIIRFGSRIGMCIVGGAARAIDVVVIVIVASSPRKSSHALCAWRAQLSWRNGLAQVANPVLVGTSPVCPEFMPFHMTSFLTLPCANNNPLCTSLYEKQSFGCADRKTDKIARQPSTPDDHRKRLVPPTLAVSSSYTHNVLVGEASISGREIDASPVASFFEHGRTTTHAQCGKCNTFSRLEFHLHNLHTTALKTKHTRHRPRQIRLEVCPGSSATEFLASTNGAEWKNENNIFVACSLSSFAPKISTPLFTDLNMNLMQRRASASCQCRPPSVKLRAMD